MADYAPPKKRSVLIAGHQTSISLEPLFWNALEAAAKERGCAINALVAEIDVARLDAGEPPNLTSAIRQWLFVERPSVRRGEDDQRVLRRSQSSDGKGSNA